ncbi:MAG: hypothetical protein OEY89_09630 [Gammaproteobacteria bacterium]|nr:hypothetical protein [Gammaproteobacteria bacterium]
MEIIYFTITAIVLYAGSDWILNQIEIQRGARLPNRSLVFLIIIGTLAFVSFTLIQNLYDKPEITNTQTAPSITTPAQNNDPK